jgi:hypothetical protein
MEKILVLVFFVGTLFTSGCATTKSAKVREQRPITVGLSTGGLGGMYRPNDTYAFGATTGGTFQEGETMTIYSPANQKALGAEEFDVLESQTSNTNLFFHYYPWADSAFYMGVKISKSDATFIYEVESQNSMVGFTGDEISSPMEGSLDEIDSTGGTTLTGSLTQVALETSSTQVKIPIGWSWIWENGISFMLELGGPILNFDQSSSYSMNGEYEGVDKQKRDVLASELKTTVGKDSAVSPFLSFGYSF